MVAVGCGVCILGVRDKKEQPISPNCRSETRYCSKDGLSAEDGLT